MSGKSQGILNWMISGNPAPDPGQEQSELGQCFLFRHVCPSTKKFFGNW